jgi:ubiquinone/menaquinone biosynthesis C-methylase UbiE
MEVDMKIAVASLILFVLTALGADPGSRYETRDSYDPNGINKFYMGRQIAHVMGHQAADWLERPEREQEEQTEKMIDSLKLKAGDNVADIGAGTGYISWRMAKKIAPNGKVYAVEIQQEMLDLLSANMQKREITNVVQVLGTISDPKLPADTLDLIIMVDVYHEFDHPYEMTEGMVRSLKPGGRLVFVEFRKEDRSVPIKEVHKMSEAQVKKEMSVHPLEYSETITNLPWQHVIIFKKIAMPRGLPPLQSAPTVPSLSPKKPETKVEGVKQNEIPK